jgi:flagellar protein FlbD
VIAVTCRNGEHFSIDPDAIERVETAHDTVVHMADGTHYVIDQSFDDLLSAVREHRAAVVSAGNRMVDDYPVIPAASRSPRRARSDAPVAVLPDTDED